MLLLFLVFTSIGGVGVYQGLQKRAALRQETAAGYYTRGLTYLQADQAELAVAEFEMALQLDPTAEEVRMRLAEARERAQHPPTPTPLPEEPATDQLYAQAKAGVARGDWAGALAALEELRSLDPDYESGQVAALLYQAFYGQGQALAGEDRLEEALHSFDQALRWKPQDPGALGQRERLSLYLSGLGFWAADWAQAVETFAQLYSLDAQYRDVADRLKQALLAYGDYSASQQKWCQAEAQYTQVLELQSDAEIEAKRAEAHERCAMASVPSPIQPAGPITITQEGQPAPTQGMLALTLYDPQSGHPALYLIQFDATGGPRWAQLGEGLAQPAFSPDGSRLAVRSSGEKEPVGLYIMDLKDQALLRLPGTAEGTHPTWSPDGQQIAFAVPGESAYSGHIYAVSSQGQETPVEVAEGWAPAWGPQGWFAYTACQGQECGIYVRAPEAKEAVRITASPHDISLAWAPDARSLAYMSDHDGDWEVHIISREGWVRQVTVNQAQDGLPAWSPDGQRLAFVSDRDGRWGLYLMRPDGGEVQALFTLSTGYGQRWVQDQLTWRP